MKNFLQNVKKAVNTGKDKGRKAVLTGLTALTLSSAMQGCVNIDEMHKVKDPDTRKELFDNAEELQNAQQIFHISDGGVRDLYATVSHNETTGIIVLNCKGHQVVIDLNEKKVVGSDLTGWVDQDKGHLVPAPMTDEEINNLVRVCVHGSTGFASEIKNQR